MWNWKKEQITMIYFWFMEAECSQIAVVVDNKEDQRMNEVYEEVILWIWINWDTFVLSVNISSSWRLKMMSIKKKQRNIKCYMYEKKLVTLQECSHEDHHMISIRDLYPMYAILKNGRVLQRHCYHCSAKKSICSV